MIKYAASYMHEENGLVKRGWRTIVIIKDIILFDSWLCNDFWAETIDIVNKFQNRLLKKSKNHEKLIFEEAWKYKCQNLSHIRIFKSLILANIPNKKSQSQITKRHDKDSVNVRSLVPDLVTYYSRDAQREWMKLSCRRSHGQKCEFLKRCANDSSQRMGEFRSREMQV